MKLNTYETLGLVFLILGMIGSLTTSFISRWMILSRGPGPYVETAIYFFISRTIFDVLFMLGFFFLLWNLKDHFNPGNNYKVSVLILLVIIILLPISSLSGIIISHLIRPEAAAYSDIFYYAVHLLGMLTVGISLILLSKSE